MERHGVAERVVRSDRDVAVCVYDGVVLHVRAVADDYFAPVAAQNRAGEDRALLPDLYVADNIRRLADPCSRVDLWRLAIERSDHR